MLLLFPAGFLIVVLLGSIAVDSAVVFLRQREAYNVVFDAANDAAALGIDRAHFDGTGELRLDPAMVEGAVRRLVAAADEGAIDVVGVSVRTSTVEVTVDYEVDRVLAGALPGASDRSTHRLVVTVEGESRFDL